MNADEAQLLSRLRRRDEAAFTELVGLYQDRVFALVYRMLGDRAEAEDVSQEVFVAVFKAIEQFRGESSLATWVYRIATNHCRNRLKYLGRRAHDRRQPLDDERHGGVESPLTQRTDRPDAIALGQELGRILQDALQELDEEHREVILLRDVEQLAYDEIAVILSVAEGTVKSRLFRARLALRNRIAARYAG